MPAETGGDASEAALQREWADVPGNDGQPGVAQHLLELAKTAGMDAALREAMAQLVRLVELRETDLPAYQLLLVDLRQAGVTRTAVDEIHRAVRVQAGRSPARRPRLRLVGGGQDTGPQPLTRVLDIWAQAPADSRCVLPAGYIAGQSGLFQQRWVGEELRSDLVAPCAGLVLSDKMLDIETGAESIALAWSYGEGWQSTTLARHVALDSRGIVTAAGLGAPVTSNTARAVVNYVAAYEAANRSYIPVRRSSAHLGWVGDGYLWGDTYLGPGDPVVFRPLDAGERQFAGLCVASGTMDGWLRLAGLVAAYPRAYLAIIAGLAAPLLRVIGAANGVLGYYGRTSVGKTTALLPATSEWGVPGLPGRGEAGLISTWRATRVAIERRSVVFHGMPTFMDDTAQASADHVQAVIYDYASGAAKARGSRSGSQQTASFSGILVVTGEQRSGTGAMGGAAARELCVTGPIWPGADAGVIHTVQAESSVHYGHAGPALVSWLLDHRNQWDRIRVAYRKRVEAYTERAGSNTVAGRLGNLMAAFDVAAMVSNRVLGLPGGSPIEPLYSELVGESDTADVALTALRHTLGWASSLADHFVGRRSESLGAPVQGWLGRWDWDSATDTWTTVCIFPHRLETELTRAGFAYEALLRSWRDRGWLLVDTDRSRLMRRVRLGGERPWMVCIRKEAADV